ncbi:hypothetical protein ACFXG4_37665 [Nocardia sp. NPDC059246]|uniref:hypothetical protein n=1 Tax=unclassified Nocardia TaxID=2637762 RepID=UPI0036CFF8FA
MTDAAMPAFFREHLWRPGWAACNLGMINHILTAAGTLSSVGGLACWLRHDGPVRLYTGITAVRHPSRAHRRDARVALDYTRTD